MKSNMSIEKIKLEMTKYVDFYGGQLLGIEDVKSANTKEELNKIIEEHRQHMELMLCDANSHLDSLKRRTEMWIL